MCVGYYCNHGAVAKNENSLRVRKTGEMKRFGSLAGMAAQWLSVDL